MNADYTDQEDLVIGDRRLYRGSGRAKIFTAETPEKPENLTTDNTD